MADQDPPTVVPVVTRMWNAVTNWRSAPGNPSPRTQAPRSRAPGSGADRRIHGAAPIRRSDGRVQRDRRVGNETFRIPGRKRPYISLASSLLARTGQLDGGITSGRIWKAEELNKERDIFVHPEGGYKVVDYDDQGGEIANQEIHTEMLGNLTTEGNEQGPHTLTNMRLVSVKPNELPRYHFWKRDDEVEPVGRYDAKEVPEIPPSAREDRIPLKRNNRPRWKVTADAVDRSFAMDRCRTFKPADFEERGERIRGFNIAENRDHHEQFNQKRRGILRLFQQQRRDLFDIVKDTFDPVQQQLLLPAIYVNLVHERQEEDTIKYHKAIGEEGPYREYPNNAITKMAMLWFGQPIAPLTYMEVTHDYNKEPDAVVGKDPEGPRFERITANETPLEFLDMFDERSFGCSMLRMKRPSPEELEKREQLWREWKSQKTDTSEKATAETPEENPSNSFRPSNTSATLQIDSASPQVEYVIPQTGLNQEKGQVKLESALTSIQQTIYGKKSDQRQETGGQQSKPSLAARNRTGTVAATKQTAAATISPLSVSFNLQQSGQGYVPKLRGGHIEDEEDIQKVIETEYEEVPSGIGTNQTAQEPYYQPSDVQHYPAAFPSILPGTTSRDTGHRNNTQFASTTQRGTITQSTPAQSGPPQSVLAQSSQAPISQYTEPESDAIVAATQTYRDVLPAPTKYEPQNVEVPQSIKATTIVRPWGLPKEGLLKFDWNGPKDQLVQLVIPLMENYVKRNINGVRFVVDYREPEPTRTFSLNDQITDQDFANVSKPPEVIWVLPYFKSIKVKDVTPSYDPARSDRSIRDSEVDWTDESKDWESFKTQLRTLYGDLYRDGAAVEIKHLAYNNEAKGDVFAGRVRSDKYWWVMNGLIRPEVYVKLAAAKNVSHPTHKPITTSNSQTGEVARTGGGSQSTHVPGVSASVPGVSNSESETILIPTGGVDRMEERLIHTMYKEGQLSTHPRLLKSESRVTKRKRTDWEEWSRNEERRDRKKHEEYTMERSIYSEDDPPIIPLSGQPLEKSISGGSSVSSVFVRNVTPSDQTRLQHQRRKLQNIQLDRIEACPICPTRFPKGTGYEEVVESHWQWHREHMKENKKCYICSGDWVGMNFHEKQEHLRAHNVTQREICPARECFENLRDTRKFESVIEAAEHIMSHEPPQITDFSSKLGVVQRSLRAAAQYSGLPIHRDFKCPHNGPDGRRCGVDFNDLVAYPTVEDVYKHITFHAEQDFAILSNAASLTTQAYTLSDDRSTSRGRAPASQNSSRARGSQDAIRDPLHEYICHEIVDRGLKECGYTAENWRTFRNHIEDTHRQLRCSICNVQCSDEVSLCRHITSKHLPARPLVCPVPTAAGTYCGRSFSEEKLLYEHALAEHSIGAPHPLRCRRSGCVFQTYDEAHFDEHITTHDGGTLRCRSCTYTSENAANLDEYVEHLKGHAEEDVKAKFQYTTQQNFPVTSFGEHGDVSTQQPISVSNFNASGDATNLQSVLASELYGDAPNPQSVPVSELEGYAFNMQHSAISDLYGLEIHSTNPRAAGDSHSAVPRNSDFLSPTHSFGASFASIGNDVPILQPQDEVRSRAAREHSDVSSSVTSVGPTVGSNSNRQSGVLIDLPENELIDLDADDDGTRYQPGAETFLHCPVCWQRANSQQYITRHVNSCQTTPDAMVRKTVYLGRLLRHRVDPHYRAPPPPADFFVPEPTPTESTPISSQVMSRMVSSNDDSLI